MSCLYVFALILFQINGLVLSQHEVCRSEDCEYYSRVYQANMNPNVDPCDNFYEYACGNFAKSHPIPDDQMEVTRFSLRNNMIYSELEEAMAGQGRSSNRTNSEALNTMIDLFLECNQTDTIEARGVAPLISEIEKAIGNWPMVKRNASKTITHWTEILTKYQANFNLNRIFMFTNSFLFEKTFFEIRMNELALPFELFKNNPESVLTLYKSFIRQLTIIFGGVDDERLTQDVEDCIALERELSKIYYSVDSNPLDKITLKELSTEFVNWTKILNEIVEITGAEHTFKETDIIVVNSLKRIQALCDFLNRTPIERIQNALGYVAAFYLSEFSTEKLRQLRFEFMNKFSNQKQNKMISRHEVCMQFVQMNFPFLLSRVYVDHHFTSEDFEHTAILIKELKKSYKNMIMTNDWMDDSTKIKSISKLEKIKENIGYPKWLLNDTHLDEMYPLGAKLKVQKGKFFETMLNLVSMYVANSFDDLDKKTNSLGNSSPEELELQIWQQIPPILTNGVYVPTLNTIFITAAIIKPPFFDKNLPSALNYGSLGMIIGHELTHAFDQSYDFSSLESSLAFKELSKCFELQYNTTEPVSGLPISGVRTLRENIADAGGIKLSYNSFLSHQALYGNSTLLPNLDLNAEQLFFLSFANNWCSVYRPERLKYVISLNTHAPEHFRANFPTANFEKFSKAFKCNVGTKQNPIQKCKLW